MSHILDFTILGLFAITILLCCYQGFIRSLISLGGFFISVLLAILLSPFMANNLSDIDIVKISLLSYSEGSEMLNEKDFELARKPISQLSPAQLSSAVENGNFPHPIGSLLERNLFSQAFADQGISQLADYISYTFLSFFCHVFAFLLIFILAFIVCIIAVAVIDSALPFPVLRRFDSLSAAAVGILLATLLGMILMLLLPIVLFMVGKQIQLVRDIVDNSIFAKLFYRNNFFFWFIRAD